MVTENELAERLWKADCERLPLGEVGLKWESNIEFYTNKAKHLLPIIKQIVEEEKD